MITYEYNIMIGKYLWTKKYLIIKKFVLKYVQGVNIFFIINKLNKKTNQNKNKIQLHIFLIYEIPHKR